MFDFQHFDMLESTDEISDPCLLARNKQKANIKIFILAL